MEDSLRRKEGRQEILDIKSSSAEQGKTSNLDDSKLQSVMSPGLCEGLLVQPAILLHEFCQTAL